MDPYSLCNRAQEIVEFAEKNRGKIELRIIDKESVCECYSAYCPAAVGALTTDASPAIMPAIKKVSNAAHRAFARFAEDPWGHSIEIGFVAAWAGYAAVQIIRTCKSVAGELH